MRNCLSSLVLAVICGWVASVDVAACGDKYIRLANRLGPAYTAQHQATVLLYAPSHSTAQAAARTLGLKGTLERAGHRVFVVEAAGDLEATLTTRTYDVVIADQVGSPMVSAKLTRAAGKPTLLPILPKTSKRDLAAARSQLGCLISARDTAVYAAAELDHVMELRKATATNP